MLAHGDGTFRTNSELPLQWLHGLSLGASDVEVDPLDQIAADLQE